MEVTLPFASVVVQWRFVVSGAPTKAVGLGPAQASQSFHLFSVGELVSDLSGKGETLSCPWSTHVIVMDKYAFK